MVVTYGPAVHTSTTMADSREMSEQAMAYRFPGEHVYKGVTYRDVVPVASLKGIEKDLELNSQDIIVASYPKSGMLKTHDPPPPLNKMAVILADDTFTEICSQESKWNQSSICSGNDWARKRCQAITWTNADLVHWRIYATLEGHGLINQ